MRRLSPAEPLESIRWEIFPSCWRGQPHAIPQLRIIARLLCEHLLDHTTWRRLSDSISPLEPIRRCTANQPGLASIERPRLKSEGLATNELVAFEPFM